MASIHIIVCIAANQAIGLDNHLLYHLRGDLKHFKELTTGHTVLMGRRTFESLPKGALPNRRNIVLTHQENKEWPNTEVFASLEDALEHCEANEEVYVIGGSSVYEEALALAQDIHLTRVDDTPALADTYFPEIKDEVWEETEREHHEADEQNEQPYDFITLKRK